MNEKLYFHHVDPSEGYRLFEITGMPYYRRLFEKEGLFNIMYFFGES